jgi:1-aminocyclopropane-1-carboxylate deaminase/D-cysteine desulfhydrase-like pyridoxal-dependent ACC family enzyme
MPNFHPLSKISHREWRELNVLKTRRNARRHDPEQIGMIVRSLERFGWVTPVLVDEDNVVLAGYGRVEAAKKLGFASVPVMVARGWSDAEKRAYMLADNQIALRAGWDEQLLKIELDELKLLDFDLTLMGFDPIELKSLDETGHLQRPIGDLRDKFILPPFSVLDAKSGWWQERKRAWLELGIQSELGRYSQTILEPDPAKRARRFAEAAPKVDLPVSEATPVERLGAIWLKRDDLFEIAGVRGGKVRTCWHLAQGARGLVTAGSRASPQVNIVAHIAQKLGVPCRVHTPTGDLSPEVRQAQDCGAEVVQHKAGYNNVIIARAREDAKARNWTNIPFGMECDEAIRQNAAQFMATEIPAGVQRIVVPVGSGMTLAGLIVGMQQAKVDLNVLGVRVGADPSARLDRYAPGWRSKVELAQSNLKYEEEAQQRRLDDIELDAIYEAKCLPFLRAGDLFWLIGLRATQGVQRHLGISAASHQAAQF